MPNNGRKGLYDDKCKNKIESLLTTPSINKILGQVLTWYKLR